METFTFKFRGMFLTTTLPSVLGFDLTALKRKAAKELKEKGFEKVLKSELKFHA